MDFTVIFLHAYNTFDHIPPHYHLICPSSHPISFFFPNSPPLVCIAFLHFWTPLVNKMCFSEPGLMRTYCSIHFPKSCTCTENPNSFKLMKTHTFAHWHNFKSVTQRSHSHNCSCTHLYPQTCSHWQHILTLHITILLHLSTQLIFTHSHVTYYWTLVHNQHAHICTQITLTISQPQLYNTLCTLNICLHSQKYTHSNGHTCLYIISNSYTKTTHSNSNTHAHIKITH